MMIVDTGLCYSKAMAITNGIAHSVRSRGYPIELPNSRTDAAIEVGGALPTGVVEMR